MIILNTIRSICIKPLNRFISMLISHSFIWSRFLRKEPPSWQAFSSMSCCRIKSFLFLSWRSHIVLLIISHIRIFDHSLIIKNSLWNGLIPYLFLSTSIFICILRTSTSAVVFILKILKYFLLHFVSWHCKIILVSASHYSTAALHFFGLYKIIHLKVYQ